MTVGALAQAQLASIFQIPSTTQILSNVDQDFYLVRPRGISNDPGFLCPTFHFSSQRNQVGISDTAWRNGACVHESCFSRGGEGRKRER